MNITYIIGNGFDKKMGLNTGYDDFYEWYVGQHPVEESEVVKRFKNEINGYIKHESSEINWSNLEVALGKYTTQVPVDKFRELYFNIVDSLKFYLKNEYNRLNTKDFDIEVFKRHLANPVADNLNLARKRILSSFRDAIPGDSDNVSIISFNYTSTIEDLLNYQGGELKWKDELSRRDVTFKAIYHIHRTLSEQNILVGVNDVYQIGSEVYQHNIDICDYLIKPSANRVLNDYIEMKCETLINETNLFVLFGTSVGITDRKWWNMIGKRLASSKNDVHLIWFAHNPDKVSHSELLYKSEERKLKSHFVEIADVRDINKEFLESKIFVTLSDKLFKM